MEIPNEITNKRLEEALKKAESRGPFTSVAIDGVTIERLVPIGSTLWFEYHCMESHDSAHAELWYHSHQQAEVLGLLTDECEEITFQTFDERTENALLLMYRVRFADGFEHDVFEDELCASPEDFEHDDPPPKPTHQ